MTQSSFLSFNIELTNNILKKCYDVGLAYFKNDYTIYSYMASDPVSLSIYNNMQNLFKLYAAKIYTTNEGNDISVSFVYYNETTKPTAITARLGLRIYLTKTYRISYLYENTQYYLVDNFSFNRKYFDDPASNPISSKLYLTYWSDLVPDTVLNVCQKTESSLFYYNLLGYQSQNTNSNYTFTAPIPYFDAMGNLQAQVIYSLRLINSYYTGPCLAVYDESNNLVDIQFDQQTGLLYYNQFPIFKTPVTQYKIGTIYNQMDITTYGKSMALTTNNPAYAPSLKWYCIQNVKVFYIEWNSTNGLYTPNKINTSSSNINKPVITVVTSFGTYNNISDTSSCTEQYSRNYNNNKVSDTNHISLLQFTDYGISLTMFPSDTSIKNIDVVAGLGEYTATLPYDIPWQNGTTQLHFRTLNICMPSANSNLKLTGGMTDTTFQQSPIKFSDPLTAPTFDSDLYWFGARNTLPHPIVSSELIIFMTDGVNVDQETIDNISKDNYNIWNTAFQLRNPDLRCDEAVKLACKISTTNQICACQPTFKSSSSKYLNNLKKKLNNTPFVNTDRWCIDPLCASSIAYKPTISQEMSTCSSICNASIHANPTKFSNLKIDRAQILTMCNNQSSNSSLSSPCGDCPINTKCAIKNGKPACLPTLTCDLNCPSGYQCVINNDTKKCVTIESSINKCQANTDCNSDEYCDTNFNICFKLTNNLSISLAIAIFIFICLLGIGLYYLYTVINHTKFVLLSKYNVLIYGIILTIAILGMIIYIIIAGKNKEQYNTTSCTSDVDCVSNNTQCINNKCSCQIGYNSISCEVNSTSICENLPYLPPGTMTGAYFYTTVINNEIYVFAVNANFKYDGKKWQEISRSSQLLKQTGFTPYNAIINNYDQTNLLGLNTSCCVTYKNKVYMFVPMYTFINQTSQSMLLCYDPTLDSSLQYATNENAWKLIKTDNIFSLISINYIDPGNKTQYVNNCFTVILNNKLYIFGGYYMNYINNKVAVYNLLTNMFEVSLDLSSFDLIKYNQYVSAFASADNNIYISGVQLQSPQQPTDTYIYKLTLKPLNFTKVAKCPIINGYVYPCLGGITTYYYVSTEIDSNKNKFVAENIAYFYYTNNNYLGQKVTIFKSGTSLQYTTSYIPYNTVGYKNPSNIISMLNIIYPLNAYLPNLYPSYLATTYFILNGFLFIVTCFGDIFRVSDYDTSTSQPEKIINIVPCYGATTFRPPLYNL